MQLFLAAEDSEAALQSELARTFPSAEIERVHPLLIKLDRHEDLRTSRLPYIAFARQWMPDAKSFHAESINDWSNLLFGCVAGLLPDDKPWQLHIEPHYGARAVQRMGARAWHSAKRASPLRTRSRRREEGQIVLAQAGHQRCRLIRKALVDLLRKKRRHLLRSLDEESKPFTSETSLVQLLLVGPDQGLISLALAPLPFEQRHIISMFPKGHVELPSDQSAPSRAFAKLVEAQLRMGHSIQKDETCVDLGASPGSWTYVAVNRGASVVAVDRSALRDDLMEHPKVRFVRGDAFEFQPNQSVDWLLCDVIAEPGRSAGLLLAWLRQGWCRNFVVTIKLKDDPGDQVLQMLKRELPALAADAYLTRLCANKKEACAFGTLR
jgi:23S rRNA (cytidine2498-2'-O)-methyltransferase